MIDFIVFEPQKNFRGLSYGEWAAIWCNWLLSENPDTYDAGMVFLRGNVDYGPVGGVPGAPHHIDSGSFYDRTGDKGISVYVGTPVFFPVLNAIISKGDLYDGNVIRTEQDMRYAAHRDLTEGRKTWANITEISRGKTKRIVKNIDKYLTESPLFQLRVSSKSHVRKKMENATRPGIYSTVTVGYYLLTIFLSPASYRLEFGGHGRGAYRTDSRYDIHIIKKKSRINGYFLL
jgi:hypothetical protein